MDEVNVFNQLTETSRNEMADTIAVAIADSKNEERPRWRLDWKSGPFVGFLDTRLWLAPIQPQRSSGTDPESTRSMASVTESASSRKRKKSDPSGTVVLLLLAFLAACALLWFGYQKLEHPAERYDSRLYRSASLQTANIAAAC